MVVVATVTRPSIAAAPAGLAGMDGRYLAVAPLSGVAVPVWHPSIFKSG